MDDQWKHYVTNGTDPGRTLVNQGRKLAEAKRQLTAQDYQELLTAWGVTARDAQLLIGCARSLGGLLSTEQDLRLPFRVRTLAALADQPKDVVLEAAQTGLIKPSMTEHDAKALAPASDRMVSSVIRPSDSWNFGSLVWPRIDGEDGHGYIPGDIYVNCLWYYAEDGDRVVDPMAGSGMLYHVWMEHERWLEEEQNIDLDIVLSDLTPRGRYKDRIVQCDLLEDFPVEHADYVIMDPPYCGVAAGQYSNLDSDLANMAVAEWEEALKVIVRRTREAQQSNGRCTVIVPNRREITNGQRWLFPEMVRRIWSANKYTLHDVVYSSRRIQRRQGKRAAILNNAARRARVPLTDVSEILTFKVC